MTLGLNLNWVNVWSISAITSGSLFVLWLSYVVKRLETRWKRHKFVVPFEQRIDAWLKYCHVKLTAKQWYGLIIGTLICFPLLGLLMPSTRMMGGVAGLYLAGNVVFYPFQKRKKFNLEMEQQVQHTKRMMAKLYERDVNTEEMLPILVDTLDDGQFTNYVIHAIERTQSTDTLADAIQWISDEIQLPSLQSLAAVLVQGTRYANLSLDERLAIMAAKDREKTLINYEKLADGKRIRALVEAGSFIALPLIGLLAAFVFEYVSHMFTSIQLF